MINFIQQLFITVKLHRERSPSFLKKYWVLQLHQKHNFCYYLGTLDRQPVRVELCLFLEVTLKCVCYVLKCKCTHSWATDAVGRCCKDAIDELCCHRPIWTLNQLSSWFCRKEKATCLMMHITTNILAVETTGWMLLLTPQSTVGHDPESCPTDFHHHKQFCHDVAYYCPSFFLLILPSGHF